MIKLIEVFDNNSLDNTLISELSFCLGVHNIILFYDSVIKNRLFKCILDCYNSVNIYIISGFNLKPYLNLIENVYDKLNIDLHMDLNYSMVFKKYCDLLEFNLFNIQFYFLSNLDKLKSMVIMAIMSNKKVIVFDTNYSKDLMKDVEFLLCKISKLDLFSDRVFIELKRQVAC